MEENSLQERTGQVSPEVQKIPQTDTAQPYQQPSNNLQLTSGQLLNSPSSLTISVPSSNSTQSSALPTPKPTNSSTFSNLWLPSLVGLVIVIGVLLAVKSRKSPVAQEDTAESKSIEVTQSEPVKKTKKSSSKNKTQKSKKKSKKKR